MLTPEAAREGRKRQREQPRAAPSKARVVELLGAGSGPDVEVSPSDDAPSPGAPTDAEVRTELRQARASLAKFTKHLNTTAFLQTGPRARVLQRRHRHRARERARDREARDHGRQRDREVPVQVGRRPRRVARQRLRLLGLRLVRARGRGPPAEPADLGRVHELRRPRARAAGSRSTRTTGTSSCSSPAFASTRAGRAARARAGRPSRARPPASPCATSPASSRCREAPRPNPSAARAPSAEASLRLRVRHRQARAPLDVGHEGGAELRVARQPGVVGGVADQLHPAPAHRLGEREAAVLREHVRIAAALLRVARRPAEHLAEPDRHVAAGGGRPFRGTRAPAARRRGPSRRSAR